MPRLLALVRRLTSMRSAMLLLGAVMAMIATPAHAASSPPPDSLAPAGAQHNWLPHEGWVWMHWLPLEEPELAHAVGLSAAGLRTYLADDTHLLITRAHARGWTAKPLARWLTRRFDGHVSQRRLSALRWRAQRILTQGHLAQHVLFHTFHGPAVPAHASELLGVSRATFLADRQAGMSPYEIGAAGGRTRAQVRAGVSALLGDEAREGVASTSESPAQSRRMLARQRGDLDCWLASPLPKLDPDNMYGGRDGDAGHGPAHAAIPGCDGMAMRQS